jgi:hypothetical protein
MNHEEELYHRVGLNSETPICRNCHHPVHVGMCNELYDSITERRFYRCACKHSEPLTLEDVLDREGRI